MELLETSAALSGLTCLMLLLFSVKKMLRSCSDCRIC